MSQGTTASTKLMLIVWALAMIFIGYKSLTSMGADSSHSNTMVEVGDLQEAKKIAKRRSSYS